MSEKETVIDQIIALATDGRPAPDERGITVVRNKLNFNEESQLRDMLQIWRSGPRLSVYDGVVKDLYPV